MDSAANQKIQAKANPLFDDPTKGVGVTPPLQPGNPGERAVELGLAAKNLYNGGEDGDKEMSLHMAAISTLRDITSGEGHLPAYATLFTLEQEERTAYNLQHASTLFENDQAEMGKALVAETLVADAEAKSGQAPQGKQYELVAQAALSEAILAAQDEDPAIESDVFSAELIERASKERAAGNLLEDALMETINYMESEYETGNELLDIGSSAFDLVGQALDPTEHVGIRGIVKKFIDDPEVMGRWDNALHGMNLRQQIAAFGYLLRTVQPADQLRILDEVTKHKFGFMGISHNPHATIRFLEMVQEYTIGEAAIDNIFRVLDSTIVLDLGLLLKPVLTQAKMAAITSRLAGAKVGGKAQAKRVIQGTDDIDTISDLDKITPAPFDAEMQQKGVTDGMREELNEEAKEFLEQYRATLVQQGAKEPEAAQAVADMAERIVHPEHMKELRGVVPPTEDAPGVVYWHGPDGRSFASREEAEQWAVARGLKNYEIIDPRSIQGTDIVPNPELSEQALKETTPNSAILDTVSKFNDINIGNMTADEMGLTYREAVDELVTYTNKAASQMENQVQHLMRFNEDLAREWFELSLDVEDFLARSEKYALDPENYAKQIDDTLTEWSKLQTKIEDLNIRSKWAINDAARNTFARLSYEGAGPNVSPALRGSRIEAAFKHITKSYGMEGDIVLYTAKEAEEMGLALLPGKSATGKRIEKGTAWRHRDSSTGKIYNFIQIDESRPVWIQARTLAHELGHIFDFNVLLNNPSLRNEMLERYTRWLEQSQGKQWKGAFMQARSNDISAKTRHALKSARSPEEFWASFKGGQKIWHEKFAEWWADQFAKHAYTNPTVADKLAQFFKASFKRMSDIYTRYAKALGYGDTDKFKNPVKAVRELLDDYVEQVKTGKGKRNFIVPDVFKEELDFSFMGQMADGVPTRVPKPRIKAKVAEVAQASRSITREQFRDAQGYIVKTDFGRDSSRWSDADLADLDIVGRSITDPRSKVIPEVYKEGVIKEYGEERIIEAVRAYIKGTFPSGKLDQRAVEELLARGDAYSNPKGGRGRIFTIDEINRSGVRVNDKVIKGYYGAVQMRKLLHQVHDELVVKSLKSRGYKNYRIRTEVRSTEAADNADAIFQGRTLSSYDSHIGARVYHAGRGRAVELTRELADELASTKGILVSLRRPKQLGLDGVADQFVLIDEATLASKATQIDEITTALGYRPGEVARYYTDPFFIDMKVSNAVDEVLKGSGYWHTVRTAPSVREAKKYVDSMNKALRVLEAWRGGNFEGNVAQEVRKLIGSHSDAEQFIERFRQGDFDGVEEFRYRYDRQTEESFDSIQDLSEGTGGVLRSARKGRLGSTTEELFDFQKNPTRGNLSTPLEALYNEARTVTRYASTQRLRTNQVEKFIRTFGDLFRNDIVEGDPWLTWRRIAERDLSADGTRRGIVAQEAKKYINEHINILSPEEVGFRNRIVRWAIDLGLEGDERTWRDAVSDTLIRSVKGGKNPINSLRGATFNLKLGMWNPAQLFVQAQGAVTAMAVSPKNGAKAVQRAVAYRLLAWAPELGPKLLEALKKSGVKVEDDMMDAVVALKSSGMLSNMAMSAFHNTDTLGKLRNANAEGFAGQRFFYNRGEEINRITSWETARLDWIDANPGKNWRAPGAQQEILVKADDYMLNMTKANRARWQKGIPSIPLQFLQWNAKFHNQLFRGLLGKGKRNFTRSQAARLMAVHYLAYGSRGNALGDAIESVVPEGFFEQFGDMSDEAKLGFTQGLVSLLFKETVEGMTGKDDSFNVALGERLGTTAWLQDIIESIGDGGSPMIEALAGPSGSTLVQGAEAAKSFGRALAHQAGTFSDPLAHTISMFYPGSDTPAWRLMFDEDGNTNTSHWAEFGKEFLDLFSSFSNGLKAYMWHQAQGYALNKSGDNVAKVTLAEQWGKAFLGADPQSVVDTYKLAKNKKAHDNILKEASDRIAEIQNDAIRYHLSGNEKMAHQKEKQWRMLWSSFDAADQESIRGFIKNNHGLDNSMREALLQELFYRTKPYDTGIQSDNPE